MPRAASGHARALYKGDDICIGLRIFQDTEFAMQVVKRDIENALCHRLNLSIS